MSFDYEKLKKSILTEHNIIRQDPSSYIPILREYMKYFKGDVLYKPREIPIQTNEGISAFQEAIKFLEKQKPLDALIYDDRLSKACEDHVKDIGPKGIVSHDSTDGKTMSDRVELYLEWDDSCGENIDLGGKTGQDVIISLLVDDGVPDRGHRQNLFKSDFKYVGIACGEHSEYEVCSVLDYVGAVRDKGKPYFDYNNFKYDFNKEKQNSPNKKNKIKSSFQLQDEDAPDGTVSVKITKNTKIINGRKLTTTRKFYTLEDGSNYIVDVEDFN